MTKLSPSTIRSITLHISKNLSKSDIYVLLHNNVPKQMIKTRKRNFDILSATLTDIASSDVIENQDIFHAVVIASLSTEYYKNQTEVNKSLRLFNSWLKQDSQEIFSLDNGLLVWIDNDSSLPNDPLTDKGSTEIEVGKKILTAPFLTSLIAEIYEGYKLLVQVVEAFEVNPSTKLNSYYVELGDIIINTGNEIHELLLKLGEESMGDKFELVYPDPFEKDIYFPSDDLLIAKSDIEKRGQTWREIKDKLYQSLHMITETAERYNVQSYLHHRHKYFFGIISLYLTDRNANINPKTLKKDPAHNYSLLLTLDGGILSIWSKALGKKIELSKIRDKGKGLFLEYILRFCSDKIKTKSYDGRFIPISKIDIYSVVDRIGKKEEINDFINKNSNGFCVYLSNLGLNKELGKLFWQSSKQSQLGFIFRSGVSLNEWDNLPEAEKNSIFQLLRKKENE